MSSKQQIKRDVCDKLSGQNSQSNNINNQPHDVQRGLHFQPRDKNADLFTRLEPKNNETDLCGVQTLTYGETPVPYEEKVILLVGATSSGKTTLINFFANYFEKVKDTDAQMYFVEPLVQNRASTHSLKAYSFCDKSDPGTVYKFIDTPGFNGKSDSEVQQQIGILISDMHKNKIKVHALGFVAPAYIVRLTSSERLVMEYVTELFGEAAKENIISFITFADQKIPQVQAALAEYDINTNHLFKFNNTMFTIGKETVSEIDEQNWSKGFRSMKKAMKVIKDMPPIDFNEMEKSKTVLEEVLEELKGGISQFVAIYQEGLRNELNEKSTSLWDLARVAAFKTTDSEKKAVDILREVIDAVCDETQSNECLKYILLAPNANIKQAATATIISFSTVYNAIKERMKKADLHARHLDFKHDQIIKMKEEVKDHIVYCSLCKEKHFIELVAGAVEKKECTMCLCKLKSHVPLPRDKKERNPDLYFLEKSTRDSFVQSLNGIIHKHSFTNLPLTLESLLEFLLEEIDEEHTDIINCTLGKDIERDEQMYKF